MNTIKSILAILTVFLLLTGCGCVGNVANAELTPEKAYGQTENDITGKWLIIVILEGKYVQGDMCQIKASDRFKAEMYICSQKDDLNSAFFWWIFRDGIVYSKGYQPEKNYDVFGDRDTPTAYEPLPQGEIPNETSDWTLEPVSATFFASFIISDTTNHMSFIDSTFDCDDFAKTFDENLELAGGDCGVAYRCRSTIHQAHMMNYVNIDGKYEFFEPQADLIVFGEGRILGNPSFDEMESLYLSGVTFTALFKDTEDFPSPLD